MFIRGRVSASQAAPTWWCQACLVAEIARTPPVCWICGGPTVPSLGWKNPTLP